MKKISPLISVIVPVYNVEKYLSRCLDSIISQSYQQLEIICVNDGSTDSSLEILKKYAELDKRIHIISQKNMGPAAARNTGMDVATGEYLSFVDSDDALVSSTYERLIDKASGKFDAICFHAQKVWEDPSHQGTVRDRLRKKTAGNILLMDEDLRHLSVTVWNKLFRRKSIESVNLRFSEGFCYEDNAFSWNFFGIYRNIYYIPEEFYLYYQRADSIMKSHENKKAGRAFHYLGIIDNIFHFWHAHHLIPEKKEVFEKEALRLFHSAVHSCQRRELSELIYSFSEYMKKWNYIPNDRYLKSIRDEEYLISLGDFPFTTDIMTLRPQHGWKKIIYSGKDYPYRVIKILGVTIFKWKMR